MSLPVNTLWYNGDWDLFVGIHTVVDPDCPCAIPPTVPHTTEESCVSRPANEFNSPNLLLGTYTDFIISDPGGWLVTGLFSDNLTSVDQSIINTLEVTYEIRTGVADNVGGTIVASGTSPVVTVPTGRTVMDGPTLYTEYRFLVSGLNIVLPPNTYYLNVAPIVPPEVLSTLGTQFILFNSTTQGTNSVGVPAGNNANDFFAVGEPIPINNFVSTTSFGQQFHDFSNGVIGIVLAVCIHPDMMVLMYDLSRKRVCELSQGDKVMTESGKFATVTINYKNPVASKVLVKMDKHALGPNVPDQQFLITTNHKIVVNNRLVKPRDLLNGKTISRSRRNKPVFTHTIITEEGEPIMINNVPVATWSVKDWNKKIHKE
jgi:hypothetical protein